MPCRSNRHPPAVSTSPIMRPPNRLPYLQIRDLWKTYGDFVALRDIELSIARGEFICFLGPSGCGKTTLLRSIAGLDLQTKGTILQDGRNISTLPASSRDYGIVFQSYALFPNLTIEQNIAFGLENTGRSKAGSRPASQNCWRRSACRPMARSIRRSFREASSSVSRLPARLPSPRGCCCSTSRSRRSTPRSVCIFATKSRHCRESSV